MPKEIQDGDVQKVGEREEQVRLQEGWEGQTRQEQTMQAIPGQVKEFELYPIGNAEPMKVLLAEHLYGYSGLEGVTVKLYREAIRMAWTWVVLERSKQI